MTDKQIVRRAILIADKAHYWRICECDGLYNIQATDGIGDRAAGFLAQVAGTAIDGAMNLIREDGTAIPVIGKFHRSTLIEKEARRRLHKAAPELLAACQMVVDRWAEGDLAEAANACQAAIDKVQFD